MAGERIPLALHHALRLDYQIQRQDLRTESLGALTTTYLRTQRLTAEYQYNNSGIMLGILGNGFLRDRQFLADPMQSFHRLQYGGQFIYNRDPRLRLRASLRRQQSFEEVLKVRDDEVDELGWELGARSELKDAGRLALSLSRRERDYESRGAKNDQTSVRANYDGDWRFASKRGHFGVLARTNFFRQEDQYGLGGDSRVLVLPFEAAWIVDYTPEEYDPLEPDPDPEPRLFDRNLSAPTAVDLGNDAPIGREYGGDYRNIQFDFVDPTRVSELVLYIDRTLSFPGLFAWQVYISDDPLGRIWVPLSSARYQVEYREFANGLQGWVVSFVSPVESRFIKLVNLKFGITEPQIFVTELEAYSVDVVQERSLENDTFSYRLEPKVDYLVTPHLRVDYRYRRQGSNTTQSVDDLVENSHLFRGAWTKDRWRVAAQYESSVTDRGEFRANDVGTTQLQFGYRVDRDLDLSAGWRHVEDQSGFDDQRTDDFNLAARWRIFPRLNVGQRFNRAIRDDRLLDLRSDALTSVSTLDAVPYRWCRFDLRHTHRWVSRIAGSGFTPYYDSTATVSLGPLPNLRYVFYGRRYVSTVSGEIARSSLFWSPRVSDRLNFRAGGTSYRDTGLDLTRYSVDAGIDWYPHRRLQLEALVSQQWTEEAGVVSRPLNLFFRALYRI